MIDVEAVMREIARLDKCLTEALADLEKSWTYGNALSVQAIRKDIKAQRNLLPRPRLVTPADELVAA